MSACLCRRIDCLIDGRCTDLVYHPQNELVKQVSGLLFSRLLILQVRHPIDISSLPHRSWTFANRKQLRAKMP